MKNRTGLLLVILFLVSMCTSSLTVTPVRAQPGTIYIRVDGSIDPSTANITTADKITYTFIGNISDMVVVERDHTVIDGAGYTVQGTGTGSGITLSSRTNVTLNNVHVTNFYYGIYLGSASNNTLLGNTVSSNVYYGIYLGSSSNNVLTGNTASGNTRGIQLYSSNSNTLSGNKASGNAVHGIYLWSACDQNVLSNNNVSNNNWAGIFVHLSNNNTLSGNTASNNQGFGGYGILLDSASNNTLIGNNASLNSYSGIYLSSSSSNTLSGNTASNNQGYGIYLSSSSSNTLSGNTASNNGPYGGYGILLDSASNQNVLTGNNASNNSYGIELSSSSSNTLSGNKASGNYYGIRLGLVNNTTLSDNTASNNQGYGIYLAGNNLVGANNTALSGNNVSNNNYGIYLSYVTNTTLSGNNVSNNSYYGISLAYSSNNTLFGNTVSNHTQYGVLLYSSSSNTFSSNTVSNNSIYGIYLISSSNNNVFYHNHFVGNTQQVNVSIGTVTAWDNGYPSGGNYWSDYTGIDAYSGPYQNETGSDGIGDTSYFIDENNQDRYPLLSHWPDTTPPTTVDDYNGLWHRADFTITLSAIDVGTGVADTYYRLNDGPTQTVSTDGPPRITTEGANNTLEYWSLDHAGNEELPHTIVADIKLDITAPNADAGQNQTVAEATVVTLNGTASTDEYSIATYTWVFTDGVILQTPRGEQPYIFPIPSLYMVTLNVTDPAGNWATDTVVITVLLDTDGDATPDTMDADDDGDGLPDTWETTHGLNPLDAADASFDSDGDGFTNFQEYGGNTDPYDSFSPFPLWIVGIVVVAVAGVAIVVYFMMIRKPERIRWI